MTAAVYLLRHAEATGQAKDAPLSDAGRRQADALVPILTAHNICRVYSSPFLRAQETIRPFCLSAGVTPILSEAAAEWDLNLSDEADWKAHISSALSNPQFAASGGETLKAVCDRGAALVADVARGPGAGVIACHGGWLTAMRQHFGADQTLEDLLNLRNPDLFQLTARGLERCDLTGGTA